VVKPGERVMAIANHIERYLRQRPRAADTPSGILEWWLGAESAEHSLHDVQSALDYLVARGRLRASTLPDGTIIYRGADGTETGEER
jgi:hypothetical protein